MGNVLQLSKCAGKIIEIEGEFILSYRFLEGFRLFKAEKYKYESGTKEEFYYQFNGPMRLVITNAIDSIGEIKFECTIIDDLSLSAITETREKCDKSKEWPLTLPGKINKLNQLKVSETMLLTKGLSVSFRDKIYIGLENFEATIDL